MPQPQRIFVSSPGDDEPIVAAGLAALAARTVEAP
jgi:hypothetical protein